MIKIMFPNKPKSTKEYEGSNLLLTMNCADIFRSFLFNNIEYMPGQYVLLSEEGEGDNKIVRSWLVGANQNKSLTIYTLWERKGIDALA